MLLDKTIKQTVRIILEEEPTTRDCDKKLIWIYLNQFAVEKNIANLGDAFQHKDFHFESVRRLRQMIQNEQPHLRGAKFEQRHKHKEVVRETILNKNL
jgi:hypothetical protein